VIRACISGWSCGCGAIGGSSLRWPFALFWSHRLASRSQLASCTFCPCTFELAVVRGQKSMVIAGCGSELTIESVTLIISPTPLTSFMSISVFIVMVGS